MADFRKKASLKRSQQMKKKCEEVEATVQLVSSNESDELEQEEQASFTVKEVDMQKGNKKRMKVMTLYLAAALDRTKVSDRKAVFVVAETAKSLGYEVDEITLSRSSIRRERMKHRSNMFQQLKTEFQEQDAKLTVHWNGKLLQNLTGKENVDRLPVIVSGKSVHQLLTVAKLASGN
ncbi:hypothetical protein AVEN_139388-1 [Araneus ventricosus]|uniref:Glutaredoxin domain-containing protein n=1 Tax=Araneus ventricosus TaxID=182803 RepID=A0A4Y2GS88_ARAVE|nr:hypothetical protein AVEN_139388-1 [Araneus ventricosus]